MSTVYFLGSALGYFIILIVATILGIIFAKKTAGWILFGTGAVVQLISLIGLQKQYSMYGGLAAKQLLRGYWITFIVILLIGGIAIASRRTKS